MKFFDKLCLLICCVTIIICITLWLSDYFIGSTARGVVRGIRNISSLTAGVFASKIVSTLGTGAVTALSGGVLTVPGAVGAAVVGVAAGVAVSSLVDNGLEAVEKWIFSSQE